MSVEMDLRKLSDLAGPDGKAAISGIRSAFRALAATARQANMASDELRGALVKIAASDERHSSEVQAALARDEHLRDTRPPRVHHAGGGRVPGI